MSDPWNYLELEDLITDQLVASGITTRILSAPDLDSVKEMTQLMPAIYVLYAGDVGTGSGGSNARGSGMVIAQRWEVGIGVRNVRTQRTQKAARTEAGPMIQAVLAALMGWEPGPRWRYFKRVLPGPKPALVDGCMFFPLLFEAEVFTP